MRIAHDTVSFRRLLSPRMVAAASFCMLHFPGVAMAHVRVPNYTHLGRPMDAGDQGARTATHLRRPGATEQGAAKVRPGCGVGVGASPAGARVAASVLGAPPLLLSEVRLDSVPRLPSGSSLERANAGAYREVFSLLDGFNARSDVVQVAEGVTPDGVSCPLYVSVGSGASKQTFWRYAPDDEPEGWFDEAGRRAGEAALAEPRPASRISSPFGPRRYYGRSSGGGFHDGIDYEAHVGEPIFAAADGVIEHQGGYFEYGLTMKIRHATKYTTLYAHMSGFARGIGVGSRVSKGELIGYVGMTGRSTGAHLHFSTIVNGKFVDPVPYLSKNGNRALNGQALATFRRWQHDIQAAVRSARDRHRLDHVNEPDWTSRT